MFFLVFWFCLVKDGFGAKNQLIPRKKMVFLRQSRPKASFYVGKVGFSLKNYLFTRQNQKTIFFNVPSPFSKKDGFFGFLVLPRKRWFWSQKPTYTSQKDGFPEAVQTKSIFLRGKSWFFYEKPSFYEAKPKKQSFSTSPPHSLKKMVFWFFGFLVLPRKRWFWSQKQTFTSQKDDFPEAVQTKTILLHGKSWFFYEKPSFYEAKPIKNIFFNIPSPFSKKDGFFGFLVSRGSVLSRDSH